MPIEHISRLVGHSSTTTTETIYRKQIRPVIVHGADVIDQIFPREMNPDAHPDAQSGCIVTQTVTQHALRVGPI